MPNDEEMKDDHFIELKTDVREILLLLQGNTKFRQKGLVERVSDHEEQIKIAKIDRDKMRHSMENFKTKVVSYTAGAAAVATAVIQLVIAYFL